jgi:hypothetical protein
MEKNFGPYLKKKKKRKKEKKKLKFFWGLIKKYFGPYLLGALGNGLSGLAIGPFAGNSLVRFPKNNLIDCRYTL